jgi:cell migration-inducing and hyaluronan-binding protein
LVLLLGCPTPELPTDDDDFAGDDDDSAGDDDDAAGDDDDSAGDDDDSFEEGTSLTDLLAQSSSEDVVVEVGDDVYIDQSIELGFIKVLGSLRCAAGFTGTVETDGILVYGEGAEFYCGTEAEPFTGDARFSLTGNRDLSEAATEITSSLGGKAVVAMMGGRISLFGDTARSTPTRLDTHLQAGASTVSISDLVDWAAGDEIVVSTTSYYPRQNETFALAASSSSGSLDLGAPAQFFHYGEEQVFNDPDGDSYLLDERAYVTNLTRNIVIMAPEDEFTADGIGAHMMVMNGGHAVVDAVEFFRVGQMGALGRYPFHWHHMGDVTGQAITNSSIHESYNRCVTIHDTHGAQVIGNTCFDHFGHGFFLESGNETGNIIQGNLGIQSKKVPVDKALLISDYNESPPDRFPGPSTYWISNPDNDVRFNVAIGSEGTGFWMAFKRYLFCDETGCVHTDDRTIANVFPIDTETLAFSDNIASSCLTGITWDGAPDGPLLANPLNPADRDVIAAHYRPPTIPSFDNLVMYKNPRAGLYFRGEQVHFTNNIFADNGTGAFLAYNQVIKDSMMVGFSANHSADELGYHYDPAIDNTSQHRRVFEGVRVYDGPFVLDNVFFAGFSDTAIYSPNGNTEITPTPITQTGGAERFVNSVKHVTFSPDPLRKFWMGGASSVNWQDSYSAGTLDIEGDLTGTPGAIIRPGHAMNNYSNCATLVAERAMVCQYEISHLRFRASNSNQTFFDVFRNDGASFESDPPPFSGAGLYHSKFPLIIDTELTYRVENLDMESSGSIDMIYSARSVGDVSPVIEIGSLTNGLCGVTSLEITGKPQLADLATLETTDATGYATEAGRFYLRLEAENLRAGISPESPQGKSTFELACQ